MTLDDITREVSEFQGLDSGLDQDIHPWINRAVKRIAQRRNWSGMHDQRQATIMAAQLSCPLDENFKALSSEKSPISYQDPTVSYAMPIPCEVISRARANRQGYSPFASPVPTLLNAYPLRYVFIERNQGGRWTLFLPQQYQVNPTVVFTISAYYYPNPLKQGTDSNVITDHPELCDAVVNLARVLAISSRDVTDKRIAGAMALYEQAYKSAAYSDVAQAMQGRSLMM